MILANENSGLSHGERGVFKTTSIVHRRRLSAGSLNSIGAFRLGGAERVSLPESFSILGAMRRK
jgi:hypothetical protein